MTDIDQLNISLWRRVTKNTKDTPLPVMTLKMRTLSTALEILGVIQALPFEKLSMSLYFYCQDVGMKEFTRAYEAQKMHAADEQRQNHLLRS